MLGVFHAFTDHLQIEVVGQIDHRADQLTTLRALVHVADETLVDLQQGNRQAAEVHEGGKPRAEVVQGKAHPQPTERQHGLLHLIAAAHHRGLGQLELQPARIDAALCD
ncbi:hypothetical protein D3C80_1791170 [compost metagenome]